MGYVAQNRSKIGKAFKSLKETAQKSIQPALEDLLAWGMSECLANHEELEEGKHTRHLYESEGYGWILFYNGQEMSRDIYRRSGGEMYVLQVSNVLDEARTLNGFTSKGWCGYVVAVMEGGVMPFSWRFENLVQATTIGAMKSLNFKDFFHRV